MKRFRRFFMQYGLVAAIAMWGAVVAMMAYRMNESPWRWAFVVLLFGGIGTVVAIFLIRKYVDAQMNESE